MKSMTLRRSVTSLIQLSLEAVALRRSRRLVHIKDKGIEPECVIMLSDGYVGNDWGEGLEAPASVVFSLAIAVLLPLWQNDSHHSYKGGCMSKLYVRIGYTNYVLDDQKALALIHLLEDAEIYEAKVVY